MSDERIDIEINDKIAASIPTKLEAIATGANKGSVNVARLKAELASINSTPVTKLKAATDTSVAAINKELAAQQGLTKATETAAGADLTAVANKAKKTAAIDAEAAAQARLAAVIDKTIARQQAAAAAGAATALGRGGNPFQAEADLAAAAARVGSSTGAMKAAVAEAEVATVGSFGRIRLAALNAYDFLRDAGAQQAANFKGFFGAGGAAKLEAEAAAIGKVGAHAKGSSTAVRELFVIAREAGRGDFTRLAGSATILGNALGLMNTVMIPAAVILGTLAAAMKLFQVSIQAEADPQLKAYANTLGLTSKEMRKLGNETVDAHGKLHEFSAIKLTFGDVFQGLKKTIEDTFNLQPELNRMKNAVYNALVTVVQAFFEAAASMSGVMVSAYKGIRALWASFGAVVGDALAQAANKSIEIIEEMVNDAIGAVNKFASGANKLIGVNLFGQISTVHLPRMKNQFAGAAAAVGHTFTNAYKEGHDNAIKFDMDFLARWKKNSIEAGKDRIKGLADAIKGNRNAPKPKKETDPKTRQDYLNDTNKKLDDELSRMHLLKDAREEQARLDQIEEEFAKRRQPLTQSEIAGFRAKIHAIQEFKYQQAEMDRIYEASTGPLRTYNASIAAAKDLLAKGAISQSDFTREVTRAGRAYREATDPLFAMKEAMSAAENALGKYGVAAQQASYYEQIRQAYLAKNIELSPQYVAGLNAEVDALMKRNAVLQQQQFVQTQVQSIVNPLLEEQQMLQAKTAMYAEIDRLRANDTLNEANAARARYALNAKFDEMRLAGARNFFGTLAGLSSSGNKKLAAIGKAAAVAQATIDGFVAVQKALASAPPPWNFIQAAAVGAMTGVQVAGILSTNVGSFEHGGAFRVDGRAGVDNNNVNMNVSRGERITIETPAQQRANDAKGGGGEPPVVNVKSVTLFDPRHMLDAMETSEGERVFMNIVERRANEISRVLG